MARNVQVEGLDELIESFRNSPELVIDVGKKHIRNLAIWTVTQSQKNILNVGAVDTNELVQGMHYNLKSTRAVIATVKPSTVADRYAVFVEEGTKPHSAPISVLQGWADRHGISVGAVWNAIRLHGTRPRLMFRKTFGETIDKADETASDIGNEIIRRI